MANSLIALRLRGHSLHDPRMAKGLRMLRSFAEEHATGFRMQSTVSPVWDTGSRHTPLRKRECRSPANPSCGRLTGS